MPNINLFLITFMMLILVDFYNDKPDKTQPIIKQVDIPIPEYKPIALVKYQNVIYHCHSVQAKTCGYTLQCNGDLAVRCATIDDIQWL